MRYTYLGDRQTDIKYRGQYCNAVLNTKGKCIRGRNGNMLVQFDEHGPQVVIARLLRKIKT